MSIGIGEVVRAVALLDFPDEVQGNNVWDWVRTDGEVTDPSDSQVAAALATKVAEIYGEWENSMSDLVTVVSTTNYRMGYENGSWIVDRLLGVQPVGVEGVATSEMLPHGNCGLITMPTLASKVRGRRFFPGIAEQFCEDGILVAGSVLDLIAAGEAYLDDVTVAATWTMSPRLLRTNGTVQGFQSIGASGTPAYQRRRKPRVGS